MRKVLISLGSNKGGEFPTFMESKQYDPSFEIFAFEPEPRCFEHIQEVMKKVPNITHIAKGAGVEDGVLSFRVGRLTVSGTLDQTKKPDMMTGEEVLIEVLDISKWVMENFNKDDHILMTMDIEGTEYDVLDKMIQDGSLDWIDKLYIEWHGAKSVGFDMNREYFLSEQLVSIMGDRVWFGWIEGDQAKAKRAMPDTGGNIYNML